MNNGLRKKQFLEVPLIIFPFEPNELSIISGIPMVGTTIGIVVRIPAVLSNSLLVIIVELFNFYFRKKIYQIKRICS